MNSAVNCVPAANITSVMDLDTKFGSAARRSSNCSLMVVVSLDLELDPPCTFIDSESGPLVIFIGICCIGILEADGLRLLHKDGLMNASVEAMLMHFHTKIEMIGTDNLMVFL